MLRPRPQFFGIIFLNMAHSRYLRFKLPLLVGPLLFLLAVGSAAQETPTVSFGFYFPGSEPEKYELVVPSTGTATYSSDGKLTSGSESDDSKLSFPLSEATRSKIFDLAKRANYFRGQLDAKKKVASTGEKTLCYNDGKQSTKATYNYSGIPAVQDLTLIFQNLSATMEFGRRLDYYHHYQKLALDEELKRMESMQKSNSLAEVAAIGPVLEQIVSDPTLINPVRARAQRILASSAPASNR